MGGGDVQLGGLGKMQYTERECSMCDEEEESRRQEGCACVCVCVFFFQAEDGIRYLVRSRGLGDEYERQASLLLKIIFLKLWKILRKCSLNRLYFFKKLY